MNYFVRVLIVVFIFLVLGTGAQCRDKQTISFNSPGVINLSGYLWRDRVFKERPIKVGILNPDIATSILRADERKWNHPEVIKWSGDKFTREDEKKLILQETKSVSRSGNILVIKPETAPAINFKDWFIPEGKGADGDSENFFYMGKVGSTGYHRVEVQYWHDSPGSFFINNKNGKIMYAHNGNDIVALSPDGNWLLVMNESAYPSFAFVVAKIASDNPTVDLHCRCPRTSESGGIVPIFKGWHKGVGYNGFDIVLKVRQKSPGAKITYQTIPIRFILKDDDWHMFSPNLSDIDQVAGLSCVQ